MEILHMVKIVLYFLINNNEIAKTKTSKIACLHNLIYDLDSVVSLSSLTLQNQNETLNRDWIGNILDTYNVN